MKACLYGFVFRQSQDSLRRAEELAREVGGLLYEYAQLAKGLSRDPEYRLDLYEGKATGLPAAGPFVGGFHSCTVLDLYPGKRQWVQGELYQMVGAAEEAAGQRRKKHQKRGG